MQEFFKNDFTGGRSTDARVTPNNQYLEAHNLEWVGDGNFYALQNIKGTTKLKEIVSNVEEIGAFATKYLIDGSIKKCITYFTVSDTLLKIWCYDTEDNDLYELYEETIADDYDTDDRVIDAINYPENGLDFLYFTDFYNPIRFIKCEIPASYTPNFLSAYDITLQRKGALGQIALSSVASGGSLLSGTYQFSYRMCDPTNKRFTKWSVPTNPIHVYDQENGDPVVHAGIGLFTNRKITLTITPSTEETDSLEYLQVAVIENVGSTPATTASLLEITAIPSTSLTFEYKANSRIGEVSLAELTVDLAQIKNAKTLRVSGNRLFAGNLNYFDLTAINPVVASGTIIAAAASTADSYSDDEFSSTKVGHWRDEVYRYAAVYEDQFGNKSTAKTLDLSGITGNTISGSTDLKYPDRSVNNDWSIFNTSGYIQGLGLQLTGITGHPTWARKLHIVRVPRKKNIQFQTPIIPMAKVYGIGAFGVYPTVYRTPAGDVTSDANQPQTSGYTLVPRNMMWPDFREITIRTATSGNKLKGEAQLQSSIVSREWMMWGSPDLYTPTPYVFSGSEKVDVVDYALLKMYSTTENPTKSPIVVSGDDVNTNISGSFYAIGSGDYYFDPNWAAKSISASLKNLPIVGYANFENLGQPTSLSGTSVMDYEALQTVGVNLGFQPNIQKSSVVQFGSNLGDITSSTKVFANGTLNVYSGGSDVVQGTGIKYESSSALKNNFVTAYGSWSQNAYVNACYVANVKLGLGDDRYGDINSYHEFISTGATYTFTPSEITTLEAGGSVSVNLDVWGGDCFVGPQTFEICDSTYSVVNQQKNYTASLGDAEGRSKWGAIFVDVGTNTIISMPVALENSAQYLTVVIESEYNGSVRDFDTLTYIGNTNGIPYTNNTSKDSMRTPLTYKYNTNLNIGNTQKIFPPKLLYSFIQNEFGARVAWSEIKIYNSDQAGFDTFKVADFIDLEEQRYDINKLVIDADQMFAIQEKGVTYLPVGERQMEQTDANLLAVRSGDVIGRPFVVDSQRGGQHLRAIIETGNGVYFPDSINKDVYVLNGGSKIALQPITKDNETLFRGIFSNHFGEKYVKGVYDFVRREYWLMIDESTQVFNPKVGWIGDYEFEPSAVFQEGLYLTLSVADLLSVYSMYTGTPNVLGATTVVPRVKVSINPEPEFSKTFDNLLLPATEDLGTGDFVVENEVGIGNQSVTGVALSTNYIENKYLVQLPYDSNHYRLRGLKLSATIKWGALQSALQSIITKYRKSKRYPF